MQQVLFDLTEKDIDLKKVDINEFVVKPVTIQQVKSFVEKYDFQYDVTLDKDGKHAINYGVKALPEKFFINKKGDIVKKYIGPIDKESLDKIIEETLD